MWAARTLRRIESGEKVAERGHSCVKVGEAAVDTSVAVDRHIIETCGAKLTEVTAGGLVHEQRRVRRAAGAGQDLLL